MILVLSNDGRLIEQGTFSELNVPGSYVHTLEVNPGACDVDSITDVTTIRDTGQAASNTSVPEVQPDEARKYGDMATYSYYSRALGRRAMSIWVLLVAIFAAFRGLGCRSLLSLIL
jgi:hypothetical protein